MNISEAQHEDFCTDLAAAAAELHEGLVSGELEWLQVDDYPQFLAPQGKRFDLWSNLDGDNVVFFGPRPGGVWVCENLEEGTTAALLTLEGARARYKELLADGFEPA